MKNLLLAIDFSPATEIGVDAAAKVARAFGSNVRLLHVAPPDPAFAHSRSWPQEVRDELAKELKHEHDALRKIATRLEAEGISAKSVLARGPIAETLLDYARETGVDLLIMASNKEGALSQFLPHSVIRGVLKKAPCPVLVVPAHEEAEDEEQEEVTA